MFDNHFESFENIPFLMNNSFNNVLNEALQRYNPYFPNDSFNYFEDINNVDEKMINNFSFWEENKHIDKDKDNIKEKAKSEGDNNDVNHKNDKNDKNNLGKKRERKHDKNAKDNILRKIQANYIKFLENLLNQINIELLQNYESKEDIQFFPLNCKMKKKINKVYFDLLKKQTLGDIFKDNVSPKFKNYEKLNIKVYNQITDKSEIIKTILDKTYLEFFDVYYLNKKTINLSKYGLNRTIILSSNIELYKDLLKKNTSDIEYQKKIEKCIKTEFMVSDKPIFFVENK